MVLRIKFSKDKERVYVKKLLQKLCSAVSVDKKGNVTVGNGPYLPKENRACCCLLNLVHHKKSVTIYPLPSPDTIVNTPKKKFKISDVAGVTIGDGAKVSKQDKGGKKVNGPGGDALVMIDGSDNKGKGYHVLDAAGKKINNPAHVILYHELCHGHAAQYVDGAHDNSAPEKDAIASENALRKDLGLSKRVGHGGGVNTTTTRPPK